MSSAADSAVRLSAVKVLFVCLLLPDWDLLLANTHFVCLLHVLD